MHCTLHTVIPAKAGTQFLLLVQPVSRAKSLGPGFRRDDGEKRRATCLPFPCPASG